MSEYMSILIEDMEMPKTPLLVCIYPNGVCSDEEGMIYKAVPVPPHGRLIDADALIAAHEQVCSLSMKFNLDLAPTIIPASEEVYDKYTDTAGNLHWTGTHSGKHIVKAEEGE